MPLSGRVKNLIFRQLFFNFFGIISISIPDVIIYSVNSILITLGIVSKNVTVVY